VYVGVLVVLLFFENWLVFRPAKADQDWQPPPVPEIQDVELTSAAGKALHAWWLPRPKGQGALLYLHGNAGNLSHRGGSMAKLAEILDVAVLIVDYPGYGKSGGKPTEQGCYQAADAGYGWLTQQGFHPQDILLYGASLGGGVAVDLASRQPHRALILIKTFTSAPDVGAGQFPYLPVRWLMRNRFDNLKKIKDCRQPVFIVHGTADSVIPYRLGQQLFAAAGEPKEFLTLPDEDHNDPLPPVFFEKLQDFLNRHAKPRSR
jgi:hypothetical protein